MNETDFSRFLNAYYKIDSCHQANILGLDCNIDDGDYDFLCEHGIIVDGTQGGLVIGPSHSNTGIAIIAKVVDNMYTVTAEIEGLEYITSETCFRSHVSQLLNYNKSYFIEDDLDAYDVPNHVTIIDCSPVIIRGNEFKRFLLMDSTNQMIVNKHASKKYLIELDELNAKYIVRKPQQSPIKSILNRWFK